MATLHDRLIEKLPSDDAEKQERGVFGHGDLEDAGENEREDGRHAGRLDERPADAENRAAIAVIQIVPGEGEPKVPKVPDIAQHAARVPGEREKNKGR